jgi:hypothetical protein
VLREAVARGTACAVLAPVNTVESLPSPPPAIDFAPEPTLASSLGPSASRVLSDATLVAPAAGLLAGALLSTSARAASRRLGLLTLSAAATAAIARWQLGRAFTWQPAYDVEFEHGRIEVRRYAAQIYAETLIEGATWNETLNEGFSRLASYIFGDNAPAEKLAMTSPVLTSLNVAAAARRSTGKTSWKPPAVASLSELNGPGTRTMAFVMPGDRSLASLPAPSDQRVKLRSIPAGRVATLRFRGRYGGDLPAQKRNELLFLLKCAGLKATSEVWFAGYDGPSTLPLLRRNEVLVEL